MKEIVHIVSVLFEYFEMTVFSFMRFLATSPVQENLRFPRNVATEFLVGVYGTAAGATASVVGASIPINNSHFFATSSNFQAGLYRDSSGCYTVAIAGTNELGDWTDANRALATQNLAAAFKTTTWDPQLSDAVRFVLLIFWKLESRLN